MKRVLASLAMLAMLLPAGAGATGFSAATAAVDLSPAEVASIVRVYVYPHLDELEYGDLLEDIVDIFGPEILSQFGTGFMVTHDGCLVTNAHVIYNEDQDQAFHDIVVEVTEDIALPPEPAYVAHVLGYDLEQDMAVLCIENDDKRVFHSWDFMDEEAIGDLEFGDTVTVLGYPYVGEETVTYSDGQVAGFLKDRNIIKTSVVSSPGGSGSPVFNEHRQVLGMVFTGFEGSLTYLLSANLLSDWEELLFGEYADEECFPREDSEYFEKEGALYYDSTCLSPRDMELEEYIEEAHEAICESSMTDSRVQQAAAQMTRSEIPWWSWEEYLYKLCAAPDEDDPLYAYFTPNQQLIGRLVRTADDPAVSFVDLDGDRFLFPSREAYASWFGHDYSEVEVISHEEMEEFAYLWPMTYKPGTLVKAASHNRVYLVGDGYRLWEVTDEPMAAELFGQDWHLDVLGMDDTHLMDYDIAGELTLPDPDDEDDFSLLEEEIFP